MRRELEAVYSELQRRHREGEKAVFLSDEVLCFLRQAAAAAPASSVGESPEPSQPAPAASPPAASVPSPAPRSPKPRKSGPDVPAPPTVTLPEGTRQEQWDFLKAAVLSDNWCRSQVKPDKKVVFGVGSVEARIFFCGEAPGAEEETQGEPFVGPAGQLLTRIIQAMGLSREQVYIGNIMNYRPSVPGPVGNRAPTAAEMAYCLPYLKAQLEIVKPAVIVALGKTAVEGLLGPDPKRRMTRFRGQWQSFDGVALMPTFHPSYLLRNKSLKTKREVWEDMLAVMEKLEMEITEKQRGYFMK